MTSRRDALARRLMLIAGAVAVGAVLLSLAAFPALPRQGDSFQYLMAARWVLGEAEYTGEYHPAGYPVFLAALMRLAGDSFGPVLVVAQHLVRLLPLVLFWRLGASGFDRRLVGVAALVWALAPEGLVFAHVVMAESVATGLGALALLALVEHARRPSVRGAALAGALVSLLALFKSAGAVWLLPLFFVRSPGRRAGRGRFILAAVAGFGIVAGGAAVAQRVKAGVWIVPASPGVHLFSRVVSDGGALPPGDPGLASLNAMVARPRNAPAAPVWNYDRTLEALGVPAAERRRIFRELALRGIAAAPGAYVLGTLRGAVEMAAWAPAAPAGASAYRVFEYRLTVPRSLPEAVADLAPGLPDPGALQWMLRELGAVFEPGVATAILGGWVAGWRAVVGVLRWPLLLLAAAGAVAAWRDWRRGGEGRMLAGCAVLWLAGHAATEMAVPRYGLPIQPLVILLACGGAAWLSGVFAKMRARR